MRCIITFRAWDRESRRMYESVIVGDGLVRYASHSAYDGGEWFKQTWDESQVELMQFTGLTDKNGKEIYVGDIVRYGDLALNDVGRFGKEPWKHLPADIKEYDISTVRGIYEIKADIPSLFDLYEAITESPDVLGAEVIGNIYNTPELMRW